MRYRTTGIVLLGLLIGVFCCFPAWAGTTGKITGTVVDQSTGEPLPGANVVIEGTTLGAAADVDGNYTILYIPPGTYNVHVSVIGYTPVAVTDVRVRIDQSARVNVEMNMEAIEGETVTVVAEKNLIRDDVASSVVAVTAEEVESLPVTNIASVAGLQAGVQNGLEIRGGQAGEALVLMDGVTLRDPRNNLPISTVALSAVKEISIERGGFNAEYGQVRSGIVNVVTREGDKSTYHGNAEFRYSPPAPKHFGISPFDPNSGWLKPYYDNEVCWTGTDNGAWDKYTQDQFPYFKGWNKVSEELMSDSDPDNDLTPINAQRKFMWETRKEPDYSQPDYNIDAGLGGPVPFIGERLGDLRFFTSYRKLREMLLVPLTRPDYVDYDWTLKVTSDISRSMKLTLSSIIGKQFRMAKNWDVDNNNPDWVDIYNLRTPTEISGSMEDRYARLFGTGEFSLADIGHKAFSAKLHHMLNSKTFYEVSLEYFVRDYKTGPPAFRDKTKKYEIAPGYFVDEAPFGYDWDDEVGITSMIFGGFTCKKRDSSVVAATTLKADITSQLNFNNLMKAGVELVYNDLDLDYGTIAPYSNSRFDTRVNYHIFPVRAAMYVQNKLETKGFIMNAGLRLDYSDSNTEWWDVDPYDRLFFTSKYDESLEFNTVESKAQWQLSPRLGISHPITENSKLFFNYGHFKQMPTYESLFNISRATDHRLSSLGDPDLVLAKTISYELGYDHSLPGDILVQAAAFYHDIQDQQNVTRYTSTGGIEYNKITSNSYADIRGFEATVRKTRGRWWTFFANYTYQVTTSGYFGWQYIYQDPSQQKRYDEQTTNLYQQRPLPTPYARLNVSFFTPDDYGFKFAGFYPAGSLLLNILTDWQAGQWQTWNPKNETGVINNVQRVDRYNTLLRLSKTVQLSKIRIMAFMDIDNLFNNKFMSMNNFGGRASDQQYYYDSLHLPKSDAYDNIPGDDRIGDYRKHGVPYQPMFSRGIIDEAVDEGDPGVIYYESTTGRYMEYVDNAWQNVDKARMNKVLDDKAYIDMPNQDSFTFLDPRQIYYGLRISFDLN
ncbi:TonB-dependent receptor [bacterium]|nr:TonB-dependent receptor [bacterium]